MALSTFDSFKTLNAADAHTVSEEELHSLQQAVLGIFDDVVSVCVSVGCEYVLGGGSALGAARHQGFIPWDDDLDLNMNRSEWPRFRAALLEKFGEKYAIYEPGSPSNYALAFPRIRLRGTRVVTREDTSPARKRPHSMQSM